VIQVRIRDAAYTKLEIAKAGYTLRGYSRVIGISHSYLSQILNQKRNPSPAIASKISAGLHEEVDAFFLIDLVDE